MFFFRVKVTWTDFVSFAFTRHFFNHNWILFRCVCSVRVVSARSSCVVKTAVSSVKVAVVLSAIVGKSAVKVDREVGPTHCPVARQIAPGEGMYIPLCIFAESIYFPGTISGFCA